MSFGDSSYGLGVRTFGALSRQGALHGSSDICRNVLLVDALACQRVDSLGRKPRRLVEADDVGG